MRFEVSIDPKDSQEWRKVASVHLDGVLLTTCVAADDTEGWVREHMSDPSDPTKALHDGTNWLYRERRGHVVITMKDRSRDWDKERRGAAKVQVGREPLSGDILVQVFSVVRPGAIKQMRLDRKYLPSGIDPQAQKAGIAAGAAAEMLCSQFGDQIDPSVAATVAIQQTTEMLLAEGKGLIVTISDQTAG